VKTAKAFLIVTYCYIVLTAVFIPLLCFLWFPAERDLIYYVFDGFSACCSVVYLVLSLLHVKTPRDYRDLFSLLVYTAVTSILSYLALALEPNYWGTDPRHGPLFLVLMVMSLAGCLESLMVGSFVMVEIHKPAKPVETPEKTEK
jgi:hypothetical protein